MHPLGPSGRDPNVDVVRGFFDAWNRRDDAGMLALLDPAATWVRSADFPEGRVLEGSEAIVDFALSMFDIFASTPIELERCTSIAAGEVLVDGRSRFLAGISGVETESSWMRLYSVRRGRITAIRAFPDEDAAHAAVEGS